MVITLRKARIMASKSQRYMAEKLGIHVQTYRKIELNPETATIRQAKVISEETGIDYDIIFFGHNSTLSR